MTMPGEARELATRIVAVSASGVEPLVIPAGFHQFDPDRDRAAIAKPKPVLDEAALQGPLGKYLMLIDPYTEAQLPAMLGTSLTMIGNMLGRRVTMQRGPTVHLQPALYTAIVGPSTFGGKGQADDEAAYLMSQIDPFYLAMHSKPGVRSGQALIKLIHDKTDTHPGVEDQRIILHEGELSRLFDSKNIQGSTLADDLKNAFDSSWRPLGNNANNSGEYYSTKHVISVLGGIVAGSLRAKTTELAIEDGFANRFIYFHTEMSQDDARPGGSERPPEVEVEAAAIADGLRRRIESRMKVGQLVDRTPEAEELWQARYPELFLPSKTGVVQALLAKGRPIVARLEMIYAAMDGHVRSKVEHLEAALAVWDYNIQTIEYIFGQEIGDPKVDGILNHLRATGAPIPRSQILRDLRQVNAHDLDIAIPILRERNLIAVGEVPTGGRPAQGLTAIAPDIGHLDNNNDQEVGR